MIEKFKKSWLVIAVVLGIVAVAMIFCSAISIDSDEYESVFSMGVNGIDATFGFEMEFEDWYDDGGVETLKVLDFSFFGFMRYLLPLAGVVLLFCAEKKADKKYTYAAIACFAVGALLFFLSTSLLQYADREMKEYFVDDGLLQIGAGAVIGGICCLLAILCTWLHLKSEEDVSAS